MQHLAESCRPSTVSPDTTAYRELLTKAIELAVWEEWSSLHHLLDSADLDQQRQGNGTVNG